ncbi:MAG: hypothetical protein HZB41_12940 [Ignavibacteriae bacterium]|nr:hypothetical protein [Ignavibacteriota bacterium]
MITEEIISEKIKEISSDESILLKMNYPALQDAFTSVIAINKSDEIIGAYTKHSAHTKTNTRGCVMGCLGG